ncbi:universal stress protein UspA [Aureitalea marina]|uniref:Universal stress protein UspA n=1 Tax=Aureitalea marina TaxID=930804 RepID=A0A2S7KTW8_9FLAO|nr:universal stress protein UspA [Aureitalea marina]
MKNILVPVSNTAHAVTNLKFAVGLASMNGATVYLINLYKEFSKVAGLTKVNQLIIEDSEAQLNEVLNQVDTQNVEVVARPVKGDSFEGIERLIKLLEIDLILLSPQSIEMDDEVYLGSITGKIVKQTMTPVMIIPGDYLFRKFETILLAFKGGYCEREEALSPVLELAKLFNARLNLLQVHTPDTAQESTDPNWLTMGDSFTETNNATIFQGVLEHFQSNNPDLLCVLRRQRGFFQKLWEKNRVMKKEFFTTKPLLILKADDQ